MVDASDVDARLRTSILTVREDPMRAVCIHEHGGPEVKLDIRYIFGRRLAIFGTWMGTKAEMQQILPLIERGRLKPVVHTVLPLEQAAEAHRLMEESRHFGKIVLRVA
jgi:NADPH:quinone reductase-like Zn-dependent oxidoreductase